MFGLGLWEIGVVVLLAVMLFPPTELPKLARSIARVYGSVRRTAEDFRSQIMEDEDLRAPIDEVRSAYNDARWQLKKAEAAARRELQKAEMEARRAAQLVKDDPDAQPPAVAAANDEEAADDYDDQHLDPAAIAADAEPASPAADPFADDPEPESPAADPFEAESDDGRVPAAPPRAYVPPPPLPKGSTPSKAEAAQPADSNAPEDRETSVA